MRLNFKFSKMQFLKRTFILTMCIVVLLTSVSFAKPGDVITYTKFTNIAAYINHYAIQSYNVNGMTCVGAEDLANFGFAVIWNDNERALYIYRNFETNDIQQYSVPYETNPSMVGKDDMPVFETDIKAYVNEMEATSYNIGGKTVINFEDLNCFGAVSWHEDLHAIKLWVEDGLEIRNTMQPLQSLPRTTLYSADGRTVKVLNNEIDDYLKVGWYKTKSEANKVAEAEKNKKTIEKNKQKINNFYIGQSVMNNLLVICKYGTVKDIDYNTGKVLVFWYEVQNGYGEKQLGMSGMMYGLNSTKWVDAVDLTPLG